MSSPAKSYFGTVKKMNLSNEEESRARKNLAMFVEAHPIQSKAHTIRAQKWSFMDVGESVTAFIHSLSLRPAMAFATVFVFFVTTSSLTAIAAEFAEPGDLLYPVKVDVVEEMIEAALSISPEVEAEWQVERIERRIEEIVELSASNELDQEDTVLLIEKIGEHINATLGLAMKLKSEEEEDDAEDVASDLIASLHAGRRLFTYLSNNQLTTTPSRKHISLMATELHNAEMEVEEEIEELESEVVAELRDEPEALFEEMEEAEQSIEAVVEEIEDGAYDAALLAEAQSKVESAQWMLQEARTQLRAAMHKQAFLQASEAGRLAEKAGELLEFEEGVLNEL